MRRGELMRATSWFICSSIVPGPIAAPGGLLVTAPEAARRAHDLTLLELTVADARKFIRALDHLFDDILRVIRLGQSASVSFAAICRRD